MKTLSVRAPLFALVGAAVALVAACGRSEQHDQLVEYQLRGGFSPRTVHLVVHRDRRAVVVTGRANRLDFVLSHSEFAALRRSLEEARFASLQPAYYGVIMDIPSTRITYEGRTVSLRAGARTPPRLGPALVQIRAIIERHERDAQ